MKRICNYCGEPLTGRSDKKYCSAHCKSALKYQKRMKGEQLYVKIER